MPDEVLYYIYNSFL